MRTNLIFLFLTVVILTSCVKTQDTCFDGQKNGNETEVDCGGDCPVKCDTTPASPPPPFVIPCQSTVSMQSMKVNSSTVVLPYIDCYYTSPYYYLLNASTSSLTGSSYYIMVHFYGYPASYARTYVATGTSSLPTNNSQVRVRAKIAGTWYYPIGTIYYDPSLGTYATYICNLVAGGYTLSAALKCN